MTSRVTVYAGAHALTVVFNGKTELIEAGALPRDYYIHSGVSIAVSETAEASTAVFGDNPAGGDNGA